MNNMDDFISKKNTAAFQEAIKILQTNMHEQEKRINSLQLAIAALTEKLTATEQMLQIQKVISMGHGPSVK
jgi:prefoldin subunit 5